MELRQLLYLVTVVEEANFTRAAAKVHIAQPSVSAQIRSLEREVGEQLLDRSGRTVRPTQAGATLLPYARAALAAITGGREAIEELRGLVRGRLAVGIMAALPSLDVAGLLADFHRRHPAVQITLAEATSDRLLDALRTGELDAALVGLPGRPPPGISAHPVHTEHLVLATRPDDELAIHTTIRLSAVRDRAFIALPAGTGLRAFIETACARAGFQPQIAFEASDPRLLAELAAHGLGVTILPRSIATAHSAQLHLLAITQPTLRGRIALAWRSGGPTSPAARRFLDHARSQLAGA